MKLRENRKYRTECQTVLISGRKQVAEYGTVKTLILCEGEDPSDLCDDYVFVPIQVMKKITGVVNPEPVAAEVALPQLLPLKGSRILALDGISDPGNLGTLLRTALAMGFDGAFLLPGCVDPFNEKAIRGSKGASFSLPLQKGTHEELKELIKELKLTPYCADTTGDENPTYASPLLLIMGSESHGPSALSKEISTSITIPMSGNAESLNVAVAGGILMHTIDKSL